MQNHQCLPVEEFSQPVKEFSQPVEEFPQLVEDFLNRYTLQVCKNVGFISYRSTDNEVVEFMQSTDTHCQFFEVIGSKNIFSSKETSVSFKKIVMLTSKLIIILRTTRSLVSLRSKTSQTIYWVLLVFWQY